MTPWLLTAISFTVLLVFWRFLHWTLDLIGRAQRALSESRNSGAQPTREREREI